MKLRLIANLAGLLILITSAASAQVETEPAQTDPEQTESVQTEPAQAEPTQDEPVQNEPVQTESAQKGTGVARVSLIHGDVSTQRGDSGDWASAVLNAPIVSGDRVSTSDNSRAELQLDYANILRIDARTQANITSLDRTQIQIQVARGLVNYSVVKDSEADVEIDAPNLSIHPRRGDGSYRINVLADDQAEVLVRRGEADISTPQGSTHVRSGQMIIVRGTGNDTQYQIADASARDHFDRWNNDRDNTIRNAQSWSRTNRYYVGSEDLDSYGRWRNVPDYGQVWEPAAASDWAPYRDGRWVWEPYWGWTWVSYEPWGWAPYHYGRWFMYENSWFGGPVSPTGILTIVRSGRRPTCRSSVSGAALVLVSDSGQWAGFRSGPVTASIRGGVDTGRALTPSTSITTTTDAAEFRRCAGERFIPTCGWRLSTTECAVVSRPSEPMTLAEAASRHGRYRARCFATEEW